MWECFFGCLPAPAIRQKGATGPEARIVQSAFHLLEEAHDEYRYLTVSQKEPKPVQKDPTKMTTNILEIMARVNKARDGLWISASELEVEAQVEKPTVRLVECLEGRAQAVDCDVGLTPADGSPGPAGDAKEPFCGVPEKPLPRLSLASTCCPDSDEVSLKAAEVDSINLLDFFDSWACGPTEPLPEISPFLGVADFSRLRRTCRNLASAKACVRHCERLLDIERGDVFSAAAEVFVLNDRLGSIAQDEIKAYIENNPRIKGMNCIGRGIDYSWKADKESVLRILTSLRAFSRREGQSFFARFLITSCATWAFKSPSKSLRHLFAKDILHILKRVNNADLLYACKALQRVRSPDRLGRFSDKIGSKLMMFVVNVKVAGRSVHNAVRLEALRVFVHLLPPQATKVYPFAGEYLRRCQRPSEDLRAELDSLLAVLDAQMATDDPEEVKPETQWCLIT